MGENGEGRGSRTLTRVVMNLIKLGGVYIALRNAAGAHDGLTYGIAALMMTGGQISEDLVLGLAARFFGVQEPAEPRRKGGRRS